MGLDGKCALKAVLFALIICSLGSPALAWNHAELEWKTIETEHFSVHFHPEVEAAAFEVARIAEYIYGPVTSLYDYEPQRVHIHVTDRAGLPEGASYYYLNRIDIHSDDLPFYLRGASNWLWNVTTHEFTHMVSLQATMKMPRWMPAFYLQAFSFEKEKRPDVITGYPNFTGSVPFSGESVPNWFAEGMAQYQASGVRNDIWDSHRDMVLRMAVIDDRLLTLDQMGVFGKTSANAELLYNQGYSLVRYIASRYGEEKIGELADGHGRLWRTGFGGACREALGISEDELYRDWKESITSEYSSQVGEVDSSGMGSKVAGEGFFNYYPVRDMDGGIYYLSNRGSDFHDIDLVRRAPDGSEKVIASGVTSGVSLSPDGSSIVYSKETDENPYGYEFNDIFSYHPANKKEERMTRALKASGPVYSPDGRQVAFVICGDGHSSIALMTAGGEGYRTVSGTEKGTRYTGLSWSSRGILAARFSGLSRDIVLVDPEGGDETVLVGTAADERDPSWAADDGFFYSSDRTGIFNVYYRDIDSGSDLKVTDVEGGAFMASPDGDDVLFTGFGREGYEIRRLPRWREVSRTPGTVADEGLISERKTNIGRSPQFGTDSLVVDDRYKITYTIPFFFPRAMVYDKKFRLGLYIDSRDYLDRQSVYAAASASFDGEFDLQLGAEFRQLKPTFRFDLLRMRKYWEIDSTDLGQVKYRYDLWDAYFTCILEFEQETLRRRKDVSIRYNHGEYGVNLNAWEVLPVEAGWNYYKADELALMFDYRNIHKDLEFDINPRGGRQAHLEVAAVRADLSAGDFEYSWQPVYNENNFTRFSAMYEEYLPLPLWAHALTVYARAGWIDREEIDDFFYLYLGSRDGLRGYSYYSIRGTKNAMARLTYRFPIWRNIDRQVPALYFRSIYGAVFAEAGKAWNENTLDLEEPRASAGYELRMSGFTFFSYPLSISFMGAYGFDEIEYEIPFFDQIVTYTEGREWKYYGSVLFSF